MKQSTWYCSSLQKVVRQRARFESETTINRRFITHLTYTLNVALWPLLAMNSPTPRATQHCTALPAASPAAPLRRPSHAEPEESEAEVPVELTSSSRRRRWAARRTAHR